MPTSKTAEDNWLVIVESQRVKGYLFASPILRETRGASLLLDHLNRVDTRQAAEEHGSSVVYLGGGSGRVLFADEGPARRFASAVEALYRDRAPGARMVAEAFQRRPGESFPEWVARGVAECHRRKLGRVEAVPSIAGRWIHPCTSCGVAPATVVTRDVQGTHRLCPSCERKRDQIATFYRQTKPRPRGPEVAVLPSAADLRRRWPESVFTTLAEHLEEAWPGAEVELPVDFDAIGAASRPRNYTGVVYVDGNRMGRVVQEIAGEFPDDGDARQAYAAFSTITDRATRTAAVRAVSETLLGELPAQDEVPPRIELPAELVLAGGDDLVLVVPAHAALPIAARFVQLFQEITLRLQEEAVGKGELERPFAKEGLTVSAGVVLAHARFPASQALDLAGELMKLAKRRAADLATEGRQEGTLDFLVLHEAGTDSAKRRRRSEYEATSPSGRPVHRTERPYTSAGLTDLLARIEALKAAAVPRGKLVAVYEALFQEPVRAQYQALVLKERLHATDALRQPALQELVDDLDRFPFRERSNGTWSTPWSELVELYEFVPAPVPETGPERQEEEVPA